MKHDDSAATSPLQGVTLDYDRQQRCGFAEVIYGPGKSPEILVEIVLELHQRGQPVLATRLDEPQMESLKSRCREGIFNSIARTFRWPLPDDSAADDSAAGESAAGESSPHQDHPVAVVSAGTGDLPIAQEAIETLRWMQVPVLEFYDVGVAGPHRLQQHVPELRQCTAIVVVAGMEGALPSVVGGHVACPVIGVPTSVGYGANLGGWSALLSMLNSCAANVTVVNIDAGFKAGYLAGLIATQGVRRAEGNVNLARTPS